MKHCPKKSCKSCEENPGAKNCQTATGEIRATTIALVPIAIKIRDYSYGMSVLKLISPPGQERCVDTYINMNRPFIIRTIYEKENHGKRNERNKYDVDNIVDKVTSYYYCSVQKEQFFEHFNREICCLP